MNAVEAKKAGQTSAPKASVTASVSSADRRGRGGEDAPASGRDQHQRDQQAELRLVGEQAEQDAGENRTAVELLSAAPISAAVRKPLWPWPRLTNTAGKGEGGEAEAIEAPRLPSCPPEPGITLAACKKLMPTPAMTGPRWRE